MRAARRRPLRIGCDMDGVVADLGAAMSRESLALFGDEGRDADHLAARRRKHLWTRVQAVENFWETLDEIEPGGVSRMAALAAERRWEVIFLTTRPDSAGDTAQRQTHRWLAAHGCSSPNVFVVRRSRGLIAAALELDVVLDDRPGNCLDVIADSEARAILTWRREQDIPTLALNRARIEVVKGFHQALDALTTMDLHRHESSSRLSAILRTFVNRSARAV